MGAVWSKLSGVCKWKMVEIYMQILNKHKIQTKYAPSLYLTKYVANTYPHPIHWRLGIFDLYAIWKHRKRILKWQNDFSILIETSSEHRRFDNVNTRWRFAFSKNVIPWYKKIKWNRPKIHWSYNSEHKLFSLKIERSIEIYV